MSTPLVFSAGGNFCIIFALFYKLRFTTKP